jgi:hypothetical protein
MMRTIALSLLATVVISAATVNRADASVAGPTKGLAMFAPDELIAQARWVCSAYRCEWHAWYPGPIHSRARLWAAPRTPGCFREVRRGRWIEVCPY